VRIAAGGRFAPQVSSPGAVAHALGYDHTGAGRRELESSADLDLRSSAANRRAAAGVIDAITLHADPRSLPARLRALGGRLRAAGTLNRRSYGVGDEETRLDPEVLHIGASAQEVVSRRRLLDAYTRPPGGRFLHRMDCLHPRELGHA
jgi:hypothetical protein